MLRAINKSISSSKIMALILSVVMILSMTPNMVRAEQVMVDEDNGTIAEQAGIDEDDEIIDGQVEVDEDDEIIDGQVEVDEDDEIIDGQVEVDEDNETTADELLEDELIDSPIDLPTATPSSASLVIDDDTEATWLIRETSARMARSIYDPSEDITHAFTDSVFRSIIRQLAGLGPTDPILRSTVSNVWSFEFRNFSIKSIAGIEYFTSLQELICDNNELTKLDISSNVLLLNLDCHMNYIPSVNHVVGWDDLGLTLGNTFVFGTQKQLDISDSFTDPNFRTAVMNELGLNSEPIYLSHVADIKRLDVSYSQIESLAGIEHFLLLERLYCNNNYLTELDLSNNLFLERLDVSNNLLYELDLTNNTKLIWFDSTSNLMIYVDETQDPAGLNGLLTPSNNSAWSIDGNSSAEPADDSPHSLPNGNADVFELSISGPNTTNSTNITVSGIASVQGRAVRSENIRFYETETAPGSERNYVNDLIEYPNGVYVGSSFNGTLLDSNATASWNATYNRELTLTGTIGSRDVWVCVPLHDNGVSAGNNPNALYAYTKMTIEYTPLSPSVTLFTYTGTYSGYVDILNTTGTIGITTYAYFGNYPSVFTVRVQNPELVGNLRVVLDCGSSNYVFDAQYDAYYDRFVASRRMPTSGFYGNGKVRVEYTRNGQPNIWYNLYERDARIYIDPSGYVYEAVPSNRLEGVTVSVYHKGKDGEEVLWDAADAGQLNPVLTDSVGYYEWFVPKGLWRVKSEFEGYETHTTDWLPVPPPQLHVNFGIKSYAAPYVKQVLPFASGIEIEFSKYMVIEDINTSNITVNVNGVPVSGSIEMLNQEVDYWYHEATEDTEEASGGTYETFVSKIKFVPDVPFTVASGIQLGINSNVRSYANVSMSSNYTESLEVELEAQEIIADNISFAHGRTNVMSVEVFPADAAAGKILYLQSTSPTLVEVPAEVTIGADGTAMVPVTGWLPGSAKINISLEGSSLTKAVEANITMDTAPVFDISLSPNADMIFEPAETGYVAQTPHSVLISNAGNRPAGMLTIALSGTHASSFTLSKTSVGNLGVGQTENFTVVPNTGLPEGVYVATVTVSGGNGISKSINVRFTVMPGTSGYSISGVVKSYNPNNYATKLELIQNNIAAYTKTLTVGSGSGQFDQSFEITGVEPGTYTLVVTKPGHLSFKVHNVVVTNGDIDLSQDIRLVGGIMVLTAGDVDGDGIIGSLDILAIQQNMNKPVGSSSMPLADIDGNGTVNSIDGNIVRNNVSKDPTVVN